MGLIPQLTDAGKAMMVKAMTGQNLNFTCVKLGNADAPSTLTSGDYWYDTENHTLHQYMDAWAKSKTPITIGSTTPAITEEGDLWYNPNTDILYKCSNGWVEQKETITCSTAAPANPSAGDYWYDTANDIFYVYGHLWNSLTTETITVRKTAPSNPNAGDYWYDTANSVLMVCVETWQNETGVNISVGDTEPENPVDGDYWYDTANTELKVCSISETEVTDDDTGETTTQKTVTWTAIEKAFTYGATAPTEPTLGDWWYDTSSNALKVYAKEWVNDTEHTFSYGSTAPESPSEGDWWYDTSLHVYEKGWVFVSDQDFTYGSAAPTKPSVGDWWYCSSDSTLYAYGLLWTVDNADKFSYAAKQPAGATSGDYWYDTTNKVLMEFMSGWYTVTDKNMTYSMVPPTSPTTGDWWYNSSSSQLYEYNGSSWVENYSTITCSISQPGSIGELTDLLNPLLTTPITEILKGSNYVSLTTKLSNANLTQSFQWSETGVFAQIDGGEEELYAYCNAGELYDYIPTVDSGRTLDVTLTLLVMVGDATDVSATIGEAALYATKAELEEHLQDNRNPHNVTAEDVGLGNVENVAPEDMTVSYTEADALAEPASGETLSTILGKIKKAIASLISHLKAENPHSITPAKIGAATSDHTHYVMGTFTGDGTVKRLISVGFNPSAVILTDGRGRMYDDAGGTCGGMAIGKYGVRGTGCGVVSHEYNWANACTAMLITTGGFYVSYYGSVIRTNTSSETYRYIAFK